MAATGIATCTNGTQRPEGRQVYTPVMVDHDPTFGFAHAPRVMRMSHASELAAGIPGARLVAVGGNTHDPFIRDVTDVVDAILAAVEGRPQEVAAQASMRPPADRLTGRESDVLNALAAGSSNEEIAARLGVSIATVERHLTNLYRKLDATAGRRSRPRHPARAREGSETTVREGVPVVRSPVLREAPRSGFLTVDGMTTICEPMPIGRADDPLV